MKPIAGLLAALLMLGVAHAAPPLPQPKLIAVYFYADWCPNCHALSAAVKEARAEGKFDAKDILFVTFDLTDKARIHQSILHAQALGIGDYLKAQGSATGYVAVLDAATKKELARFDRESTSTSIRNALDGLL